MAHGKAYRNAEEKIEKARRSVATELDLSRMGLTELPESLGQLTQLQSLILSGNRLTTLPELLGQLTQLQILGLGVGFEGNPIVELPTCIRRLRELTYLSINALQLSSLPD